MTGALHNARKGDTLRDYCRFALLVLPAALVSSPPSVAQTGVFPSKPVTIVLGVAPGGGTDFEMRFYTTKMSEYLGRPFLLDYKSGAGGIVATAFVAKAPADGHTLHALSGNFTLMPAVNKNLPFDILNDFAPVSLMSEQPQIFLSSLSFQARNFPEMIGHARANPGKVNVGTTTQGGINHFMHMWQHSLTNTKVTYVGYKGMGPLLPDLFSGRIDVAALVITQAIPLVKAGKVRALGTSMSTRAEVWPDLPTIAEQGAPEFNYKSWVGIGAPSGTPVAVIDKLSENFAKVAKAADVKAALATQGTVLVGSTPAELRKLIVTETTRWKRLVEENGIIVDQ